MQPGHTIRPTKRRAPRSAGRAADRFAFFGALLAAATCVTGTAPVHADPELFAGFQLGAGAPASPFVFTNSGATSQLVATSVPVNFSYNTPNLYNTLAGTPVGSTIPAVLNLTATVGSPATLFPGNFLSQPIATINLTITATLPQLGLTNLLTVTGNGSLSGLVGGLPGLYGDTGPLFLNTVDFTSDFLNFNTPTFQRQINLALIGVTPGFQQNAGNQYVSSFRAGGSGTFASDPVPPSVVAPGVVPEPGTFALAVPALAAIAVRRRRRRTAG